MSRTLLGRVEHRPWPLPVGHWVIRQGWDELLFAHWPLPPAALQPLLPAGLELDTFEGVAWLGIVPFSMRRVRLRLLPSMPGVSSFPELNVRTYVIAEGRPGVWFFSLDAASTLAVATARRWYHLPYFRARMTTRRDGDTIVYTSERAHRGAPPAAFHARYRPAGSPGVAPIGSHTHWLTERYCLYCVDGQGRLCRGDIHHPPWTLQPASAEFALNTLVEPLGVALPDAPPLLHYAVRQDVVAWAIRPVDQSE